MRSARSPVLQAGALLALALGCAGLTSPPPTSVVVTATWDGADALSVEQDLLEPLERALSAVPGVQRVDGRADDGVARVEVTLTGDDISGLRDALPLRSLPADADPPVVVRRDAGVKWLSVRVDRADAVADELLRTPGISDVVRHGGVERRIEVRVDPAKLQAFALDAAALISGIRACTVELPAGRIEGMLVRVTGAVDVAGVADCRVGAEVRVRDVATVEDAAAEITAVGPDGPIGLLEVRTSLDRVVHIEATSLDEPVRVRPADLKSLRATWPAATVLADADDAYVWADPAGAPPGFDVWAPTGEVHEVVVTGPEIDEIAALVQVVRAGIGRPTWTDLPPERPELDFEIDRARAAERGVSVESVGEAIAVVHGGIAVGMSGDTEIRLIVEAPTPADVGAIGVLASDGSLVPLSDLVTVKMRTTRSILHKDLQRGASILVDGEVPDLSGIPIPTGMAITVRP